MILQWRMEPSTRGWMDRLAKQKAKTGSGSLPSSRLGCSCSCCCWWYFYFWRMARQYKIRSVQNQRPSSGKLDREATPSEASIPRLPPRRRRSGGSVGGAPSCQSRLTATFHYYSPPLLYSILFPWFYFINSTRSSSPPRSFISKRMATRQECLGYGGEKAKARIAKNTNTKVKSTLARVN